MPAVTLTALACAAALLASADDRDALLLSPRTRAAGTIAALLLAVVAFVGVVGASALAASDRELAKGSYTDAASQARKAARWWRWSPQPWQQLGDIASEQGDDSAARGYYLKALSKDDRNWKLWYDLSTVTTGRSRAAPSRGRSSSTGSRGRTSRRAMFRVDPLANPEPLIKRVYAYVAYRVGDGPDAEDLTSETFERALRYKKSYDSSKGEPIAWLIGIARRCIEGRPPQFELSSEQLDTADHRNLEDETLRKIVALRRRRAPRGTRPRAGRAPLRRGSHRAPDRRAPGVEDERCRGRAPPRARSPEIPPGRRFRGACKEIGGKPVVEV